MVRQRGCLSIAQARVLRVLSCGLFERDFIVTGARRGRYEITRLERDALAANRSGHGRLDA
ncbi:hypothetical protein [Nocardia miyunensis]|uniref:hypothetical protein n=1 Tax=Nocardia miyunensis TaxID=282684 RepID=UPI0012F4EF80|nr:hypothetical protein [Nocardia miyunensis]